MTKSPTRRRPAVTPGTRAERVLDEILAAVLTSEERRLLIAFDALDDPRVRQSLIDVAEAAAGVTDFHPDADALSEEGAPAARDSSVGVRAVRRSLLRPRREKE